MEEGPRTSLLARAWVQALALLLVTVTSFGTAIGGTLVWDDFRVLGAAAGAASPLDVFRIGLFGSDPGERAQYYRPLTSLSYWAEVRLFDEAPNVGMRVSNLLWHAATATLLLYAIRRLLGVRNDVEPARNAACFVAVLTWTVMPLKAENVAWITGRGDVLGGAFLLAGLAFAARAKSARGQAAAAAFFTLLAVLCKEAMVAAPALFVGAALADAVRDGRAGKLRTHLREALLRPASLGSFGVALAYLAARRIAFPISTGGDNLFKGFTFSDRAGLFFETSGIAFTAVLTPWRSELLRGQIAFASGGRLVHDLPAMLALGIAGWVLLAALAVRYAPARAPVCWGLGLFLPASNFILIPLESRLSDRFLYVPSIGLALGLALALAALRPASWRTLAIVGAAAASALLFVRARARAELFFSSDALFQWEVKSGNRGLAVLSNAAFAAASESRYREARDLHLDLAQRYQELHYPGAGFTSLILGLRAQVTATEDSFPEASRGYERLCRALMAERDETVTVPLDNGKVYKVDTSTEPARRHYREHRLEVRESLAWILARRGLPEGLEIAKENVEQCINCNDFLIAAAQTALAASEPDLAETWAERARAMTPRRATLVDMARVQRAILLSPSPQARALSAFLGGSFRQACVDGVKAGGLDDDKIRNVVGAACWLAPERELALQLMGGDVARLDALAKVADPLRYADEERTELARAAGGLQ